MDSSSICGSFNMNQTLEVRIKVCRICLSKVSEQNIDPLFEPLHDGFSIAEILEAVSNIKIDKDSVMPNMVCKNCTKVIFDFRYLIKTFYDSEEYLKATLFKEEVPLLERNQEENLECNSYKNESLFSNNDECASLYSDHAGSLTEEEKADDADATIPLPSANENDDQISQTINDINNEPAEMDISLRNSETNSTNGREVKIIDEQKPNSETQEVPTIKYTCEICGDCFLFKSGFGHHMLMVHNICIQVNQYEQYSSQITIKVPISLSENETKFVRRSNPPIPLYKTEVQCRKCKETFLTIEALKEHNEVHKTFRCDQCGAAFIKNSYLRDHLLKHSADKCYSCKDCGRAFKYRSALAIHRREHVGTNTGHMCETCGRNFKERGTLKTHIMLKHTNERNFPCSGCDLTFKLKAARDKHYLRKHTFNRTKDFVCSTCGMAYLNKETLTRHMADKHTGTPSFHWCTVCQKSFTMKSNLSKHLRNKHNVIIKKDQF